MIAPHLMIVRTFTFLVILTAILGAAIGRAPMAHAENTPPGRPGTPKHVDRTITLAIKDKGFGPKTIKIRAHETVRFVIKNHDNIHHAFVLGAKSASSATITATLDGRNIELSPATPWAVDVPAGTSRGLIWTFASAGTATFYCTQPGHTAEGMHGEISVTK